MLTVAAQASPNQPLPLIKLMMLIEIIDFKNPWALFTIKARLPGLMLEVFISLPWRNSKNGYRETSSPA
jgi:hypothetical protein